MPVENKKYIKKVFKEGRIVCLTGAGISFESGIPVFRGKGGLWEKYDPDIYADSEGLNALFAGHPEKFADFICDFYQLLLEAKPNPAHMALSLLQQSGAVEVIITQNIDNLHQEAGSRSVIELHGNALRIKCTGCNSSITLEKERLKEFTRLLKLSALSRMKILKILSRYFPRCRKCNRRYRVDIVLFKEMLPEKELSLAYKSLDVCKTLLVIGSSLVVHPASGLPRYAKKQGARLIEINSQHSVLSDLCDYKIIGQAGVVLPGILKMLEEG